MYNDNDYDRPQMQKTPNDEPLQEPDFLKLLNSLRKQSILLTDMTNHASTLSNGLKEMDLLRHSKDFKEQPNLPEKEPSSVVDHLWAEIWKIEKANQKLAEVVNHLQRVIGS